MNETSEGSKVKNKIILYRAETLAKHLCHLNNLCERNCRENGVILLNYSGVSKTEFGCGPTGTVVESLYWSG